MPTGRHRLGTIPEPHKHAGFLVFVSGVGWKTKQTSLQTAGTRLEDEQCMRNDDNHYSQAGRMAKGR